MPLGQTEGVLLTVGTALVGATTYFFKKKQTLPFKLAHFAAWPVLGTGIILTCMPSHDQMADTLRQSGLADERKQAIASGAAADQLAAIQKVAGDSRPFKPSL
mmetsp:Transcript_11938/g.35745  ORF Transcript_11938/g.35745 Transcript_11938/m.35745 type:complete len:103 (-) Transcript_11938:2177-2485(-)